VGNVVGGGGRSNRSPKQGRKKEMGNQVAWPEETTKKGRIEPKTPEGGGGKRKLLG